MTSDTAASAYEPFLKRLVEEGKISSQGASEEQIASFAQTYEARYGLPAPAEYCQFLRRVDGFQCGGVTLFGTSELLTRNEGDSYPHPWQGRRRIVLGQSRTTLYVVFPGTSYADYYTIDLESGSRTWQRPFGRLAVHALCAALGVPVPTRPLSAEWINISTPDQKDSSLSQMVREERDLFIKGRVDRFWNDYRAGKFAGMTTDEASLRAMEAENAAWEEWFATQPK